MYLMINKDQERRLPNALWGNCR